MISDRAKMPSPNPSSRPLPRVLLIESACTWRARAALWLRSRGHATEAAHGFQEAYLLLSLQPPDIAVLDLDDVDAESLAAIADMMDRQQRVAPILVANPDRLPNVVTALRQGLACDFVEKPLNSAQALISAIDRAWRLAIGS